MPESDKIEVNKVQIEDVREAGDELTEAEQQNVSGGGGGYNLSGEDAASWG